MYHVLYMCKQNKRELSQIIRSTYVNVNESGVSVSLTEHRDSDG